ncbi:MAG: hypothetical protein H0W34_08285 [Pyrinomonadaceae bacterium]|nr:hypothetical protein [Pyrinomonadaceae bacterium]
MPQFKRYIGIDYSGAETPTSSLSSLRVHEAEADSRRLPIEVPPAPSPRKYWTRRGIAEWLREQMLTSADDGIDHAFLFPVHYFEMHGLPLDWRSFLEDFRKHWPTHEDHTYVDFI